jgi:carbonic anhydrase
MKTQNSETQKEMTPDMALERLLEGNRRFTANVRANRDLMKEVEETARGQFPYAVILSCIDSRLSSELIFDLGMGDVFNARIAGNVVNDDILGSMEFACKLAGAKLIMVLGHTACGAVNGACRDAKLGLLSGLLEKIKPAIEKVEGRADITEKDTEAHINEVSKVNVLLTAAKITQESRVLAEMADNGEIQIVSAMYDVKSGAVNLLK